MVSSGLLTSGLLRGGLLLLLWLILMQGSIGSLAYALPLIVIAVAISLRLLPPVRHGIRWLAFPGFLAYFLIEMFKGGADVAGRALRPRLSIQPRFLTFPFRLERPASRIFLTWTAGLLPGTVSVSLRADELEIHVLDERMPIDENMRDLEERIASLFGEQLRGNG